MKNNISKSDYRVIPYIENSNSYQFKVTDNKYAGVVVTYGKVGLTEPMEGGEQATLSFEYNLHETGIYEKDELENSDEFQQYLGDMLVHFIENSLDDFKIGERDAADGNIAESDNT